MDREITCTVDFQVNDSLRSVCAFISHVEPAEGLKAGDVLSMDFSRCRYLGPFAAALLASIFLYWTKRGHIVRVTPPLEPTELRAFWHFSGLDELVSVGKLTTDMDPAKHPNLPLRQIEKASFQAADPVIALVHAYQELPDDWEEAIRTCVNEVVQNIQDHANSSIGGVMSARFMEKTSTVRVAVVDRGKGICTTLKKRFPDTSAANALQRVIQGNYSALSRPNNMGVGISNLANIINALKGDFHLVSETSVASSRAGSAFTFSELPCPFRGTGVFFVLPYQQLRFSS